MPESEVQEVHSTYIDARPSPALAAILAATPGETALARPLLWVRLLPGRVSGSGRTDDGLWNRPFLKVPSPAVLGAFPDREIVVGLIGEFWKLRQGERVTV